MVDEMPRYLKQVIMYGEGTTCEFKIAKNGLPSNLFETICAMLNRNGGHIFLGIKDDGEIVGIDRESIRLLRKEFADLCNNSQKIYPTVHLEIKEYLYDEKSVLYVYVHESSSVHKTVNRVFDRNEDGDFDVTSNTNLLSELYIRKKNTYIENKIYPYAKMSDLRPDLIDKVRKMAFNRTANHSWFSMTNEEMLRSAGLYERNLETGEEGITLACILLFGKDEVIESVLPYHKTDAILRLNNVDRYDDRDDIKTNLLDSYDRLVNFIKKNLPDKFYMEDNLRINVRDVIARELCSNLLIHREFSNPYPAKLIITKDGIYTENANKPRTIGYMDLSNYTPYPKNPKIAKVFKEIGLVDELGSGIRKVVKYTKAYGEEMPTFKDGDIFKTFVPYDRESDEIEEVNNISNEQLRELIYEFIKNNNGCTRRDINNYVYPILNKDISIMNSKIRTSLTKLRMEGLICNCGSDIKSLWKIK